MENKNNVLKIIISVLAVILSVFFGKEIVFDDELPVEEVSVSTVTTQEYTEKVTEVITTTERVTEQTTVKEVTEQKEVNYYFANKNLLESHFKKHGAEFEGIYKTAEEYEKGASKVINSPDALYKTEKEDGDHIYYIEKTNEFVVLSTSGKIRTYFKPTDGIEYFNRQ